MKRLSQLAVGESARVLEIHGDDVLSSRLMEMGLVTGIEVTLIGTAPLGDPIEMEIRGYRLSLRKSEADRVEVEDS